MLQRIDNFGTFRNTAYTSIPFSLSYYQSNLFYNNFKWQKKIEPLRLQEAQRGYIENLEIISYNTTEKYFELLLADVQLKLDQQNLKNIDTLIKITQSRFEIGTVQLNDVLQSKVSLLTAKKAIASSLLRLEVTKQNLVRFLNLSKEDSLELILPSEMINFKVSPEIALEKAQNNSKFVVEIQRQRLEADLLMLAQILGLTQRGNTFVQSYEDLLRNQSVSIGFNIPLIDWGINKSNRKRSEANLELMNNNIAQQRLSIEQEVYYQVMKWTMQQEQMDIAKEASELSQQRYDIAKQKYSLGSISYTDFNNAQLDKDRAVIDYINNLNTYWSLYYLIRRLTLFDFEKNKKIELRDMNFG